MGLIPLQGKETTALERTVGRKKKLGRRRMKMIYEGKTKYTRQEKISLEQEQMDTAMAQNNVANGQHAQNANYLI